MFSSPHNQRLIAIAGPTACGKSAFALSLAQSMGGEIVNADAVQVYADLDILSARPSLAHMEAIPHHLYGAWDGAVAASVAQWRAAAEVIIAQIWQRGATPIVVGGSGLYMRAVLEGIAEIPSIPEDVRISVRHLGPEDCAAALAREDPIMAARLHPHDRQRIGRALEVVRATGRSLASFYQEKPGGLARQCDVTRYKIVPADRQSLYQRCDARVLDMMAAGAIDEVRRLLARGLDPDVPVMKAVGVPELARHLREAWPLPEAISALQRATRRYAKRQMTWLNHQCGDWPVVHVEDNTHKKLK